MTAIVVTSCGFFCFFSPDGEVRKNISHRRGDRVNRCMSMSSPVKRRRYLPLDPAVEVERHEQRIRELEATIAQLEVSGRASTVRSQTPTQSDAAAGPDGLSRPRVARSSDEIAVIVERLNRPLPTPDPEEVFPPLSGQKRGQPPRVLQADEVENLVDRLAVADVAARSQKVSEQLEALDETVPWKVALAAKGEDALAKLDGETQQALGERLCNQALATRAEKIGTERARFLSVAMRSHAQRTVIGKSQAIACGKRLCDDELLKRDTEMKALQATYMGPLVPPKKLTKAEQDACASRLSSKK